MAQPIEAAAREAAPWVAKLARLGHVAVALVYATVGILAAQAAFGQGGKATDLTGALREVVRAPMGNVLLLACALGLAGSAVWRFIDAFTDAERRGPGLRAILDRASSALVGVGQGTLAVAAFELATGAGTGGSVGGAHLRQLAARLLDFPGGQWLTWGIALGLLGYGADQVRRGFTAKLDRQLDLAALAAESSRWVTLVCRFGIVARGVVYAVIGMLLVHATTQRDPGEAGGIRESLQALGRTGRWFLAVVALGLVAYAVYELVRARYRRVP